MKTINKLVALAGMVLFSGLATSCQNEELAVADNGQPLLLNLSATIGGGQGSGELTRAGEESSVAMNIPDGTTLTIHYYKTTEGISGASGQYALYTTTKQIDGSGAVSYALNLSDGYKDIIDYTRGKDYTLRSYAANKFSISQPRTDGSSDNYDVPFYSVVDSYVKDPVITANSATGKAPYTLQIKLLFAGMRFQFKLADDLKLAGYTAEFVDFTPMMGDIDDPTFQVDRRASLAATSCAVVGAVNTNTAVSGGATAGILTVKFTNTAEKTTEERKLRITLPSTGIDKPVAGNLYTYNVTVDRKEALTAQAVQIASFTTANGNGNGEDIIQGGDGMLHWTYDFAGMNIDQISAQITQIKNRMANIVIPGGNSDGVVALTLNNLATIPFAAFSDCTQLGSINLPSTTFIEQSAFSSCTRLKSVNSPIAEIIVWGAFQTCSALESVNFPVATNIGQFVFAYCTKLNDVSLPMANNIGDSAFAYSDAITTLKLTAAGKIGIYTDSFYHFGNSANCTLYLNSNKGNGGSSTPTVGTDGLTWGGVTWKTIKYE